MKLFYRGKDGGPESSVTGWWLIEAKKMFSIALLKFEGASREAYHDHAFNSISWVLRGFGLYESFLKGGSRYLFPSWRPVVTSRDTFHKVSSIGTTWVLTFRGPWSETWHEHVGGEEITL